MACKYKGLKNLLGYWAIFLQWNIGWMISKSHILIDYVFFKRLIRRECRRKGCFHCDVIIMKAAVVPVEKYHKTPKNVFYCLLWHTKRNCCKHRSTQWPMFYIKSCNVARKIVFHKSIYIHIYIYIYNEPPS